MDELGLKRYCCRRMIMTHVDLIEKLLKYDSMRKSSPTWILQNANPRLAQVYPRRPKRDQAEAQRNGIKYRARIRMTCRLSWDGVFRYFFFSARWDGVRQGNFCDSHMTNMLTYWNKCLSVCQEIVECENGAVRAKRGKQCTASAPRKGL